MTQMSIRIDDSVKEKADAILSELGLNMSTAVNMFTRQIIQQGGIPFPVQLYDRQIAERQRKEQIIAKGRESLSKLRKDADINGFMTDNEIEAEIQSYRNEKRNK